MLGTEGMQVVAADVGAAGERDRAVDGEDLAVIPEIEEGESRMAQLRGEELGPDPRLPQRNMRAWPGVERSEAVDEDAHLDPTAMRGDEGIDEWPSRLVGREDVGGERDGVLRAVDRLEHRGIALVPILEDSHLVPADDGTVGQAIAELGEGAELWVGEDLALGACDPHRGRRAEREPAPLPMELARAPLDPIEPEGRVDDRPDPGREPDEPHPPDRGADIPLAQHRVQARHEAHREGEGPGRVGPPGGEGVEEGAHRDPLNVLSGYTPVAPRSRSWS